MARIGVNPARGKVSDHRPAPVTVVVLTYIPSISGYFEHRLEVLKLVFASLLAHTTSPYDLMVFDNGSCPVVINYLLEMQKAGQIDYLILSPKNIGKIDALKILFHAAPGEIIAYNDDDILFYPGWLEAHLEILKLFPKTGMVSGVAVRKAAEHARDSLERLATEGAPGLITLRERRIQSTWEADWALSTGRDPQVHLRATQDHLDLVLRLKKPVNRGVIGDEQGFIEAIGSANHFQFVSPKQVILQALPEEWIGKLMGSMIELDEAVDNLGYLRLSTVDRYTRHLGNILSDDVVREAQTLGLLAKKKVDGQKALFTQAVRRNDFNKRHWLLHLPGGRRVLTKIYNQIFNILYR